MNHEVNKQSGFTIVELTISMAFISVMLIAIALIVIQIGGIYSRGVTLKELNQAGRLISANLQESINVSAPFQIKYDPDATSVSIVEQTWGGGALCVGGYSYVWNDGSAIRNALSNQTNYDTKLNIFFGVSYQVNMPSNKIPHFVKIYDPSRSSCSQAPNSTIKIDSAKSTELMAVGQIDIVIHDFDIMTTSGSFSSSINQQLYDVNILIGTNEGAALNIDATSGVAQSCKVPSAFNSNITYCSLQEFHFVARAGGIN